jgi:pimeloyl-ACP methyl ester carboxylesterase
VRTEFDTRYRNVPQEKKDFLRQFRSTHPYKKLTVNSVQWEYICCGTGEPVVLLPGGGFRLGETWLHLIAALESQYRIISPTYPAVPTMAARVKGISALVQSETTDSVHMLGWSLGGWTAQCFVHQHPDTVKTLILSNTSTPDSMSQLVLRAAPILLPVYPMRIFQMGLQKSMMVLLKSSGAEYEFWKAFTEDISLKTTKDDILNERKAMLDYVSNYQFSRNDLADWQGRILIIESDNDSAFKRPEREALKALYPQADVHTFCNSGHSPHYDTPAEYIAVVKDFLKGV